MQLKNWNIAHKLAICGFLFGATDLFAQGLSCMSNAVAVSRETLCKCSGQSGFAGGCMATVGSNYACSYLSMYECASGAACYFYYTETADTCLTNAKPQVKAFAKPNADPELERTLASLKSSAKPVVSYDCTNSGQSFQAWLSQELIKQHNKLRTIASR